MFRKHTTSIKVLFSSLAILWTAEIYFPKIAYAEGQGSTHWQRYLPEWLQKISQDDFPESQKEAQDIERFFEGMKPVPGEEAGKKPFAERQEETPSVRIYGPAELKNTSVDGGIHIHGPTFLRNAECHELRVEGPLDASHVSFKGGILNGPTKLEKAKVTGSLTVYGPFLTRNSSFKGKIMAGGEKMIMSSCKVEGDILILPLENHAPQKLFLLEGTEIQGHVTFQEDNPGNQVIMDKKSQIHGEMKGASQVQP